MRRALPTLLVLCACAARSPSSSRLMDVPQPPAAERQVRLGGGQWLLPITVESEIARERDDLGTFDLVLEKLPGTPSVKMLGFREPELMDTEDESLTIIRTLLDEDVLVECIIRNDRLDLAQSFHRVSSAMERRPALSMRRMGEVDRMPSGSWPLMMMRMEYLTPERQYGSVHMAATNVHDIGVFCSADAPGFAKTFRRVVSLVVDSLRGAVPDRSVHRSFHWVEAQDGWEGLVESVERVRPDGTHLDMQFASLLRPQPLRLHVLDEVQMEVTRDDGGLVIMRLVRQQDGQLQRDLTLSPSPSKHTTLRGRQDPGAEEDLGSPLPATGRELRAHYIQAINGSTPARTFVRYYPGMETGALAEETVELVSKAPEGATFHSTIRTPRSSVVEGTYEVGTDGNLLKSTIRSAGATVTLERLFPLPH